MWSSYFIPVENCSIYTPTNNIISTIHKKSRVEKIENYKNKFRLVYTIITIVHISFCHRQVLNIYKVIVKHKSFEI